MTAYDHVSLKRICKLNSLDYKETSLKKVFLIILKDKTLTKLPYPFRPRGVEWKKNNK